MHSSDSRYQDGTNFNEALSAKSPLEKRCCATCHSSWKNYGPRQPPV